MGISRIGCRAQWGLAAPEVAVEVHLGAGLPCFHIVGLPATEVKESRDRVRAALTNSGFDIPAGRITVNLAPADLPKDGGRFDLAIALGILVASGQLTPQRSLADTEFLGELGLDGHLRAVRGALPAIVAAGRAGRRIVTPPLAPAALVGLSGIELHQAGSLLGVCAWLEGRTLEEPQIEISSSVANRSTASPSLDDVYGQGLGKRALEVAAAGGHSLLMVGPPGCGKSLLAARLSSLLPPLAADEALEIAMIASVAAPLRALGEQSSPLGRPFRAPHHTVSTSALVGGGPAAQPGEITLAHRGVLFLDELPEFDRRSLEALREPLETGRVSVVRVGAQADYPAAFQLVAAMNPCPCGLQGVRGGRCRCRPADIDRYQARLSGPLLDRLDLRITLEAVSEAERAERGQGLEPTLRHEAIRRRVAAARERQHQRQGRLNAALEPAKVEELPLSAAACSRLAHARRAWSLGLRAEHRLLRVARTVADLAASETVEEEHLAFALSLRRTAATTG